MDMITGLLGSEDGVEGFLAACDMQKHIHHGLSPAVGSQHGITSYGNRPAFTARQ